VLRVLLSGCSAAAVAAAIAGCGEEAPPRPDPPVRVSVAQPVDAATVRDGEVKLSGKVVPAGAAVIVGGETASVSDGEFAATVSLDPGTNVVDVMASAQGRSATMVAVRVTRVVTVEIPDVVGDKPDDAVDALRDAGLVPRLERSGGLFDDLFGGEISVCAMEPDPGEEVDRGATVRLAVSRLC
jgi:hypothetical protein